MVCRSDDFRVLRMLQWSMKTKSEGKEERKRRRNLKDRKVKQTASCVSHISELRHFLDNPTIHIEDQWVENNISKFHLNPAVDEVAMIIFPKGVCLAPGQRLQAPETQEETPSDLSSACPTPGQRLQAPDTQKQHKTRFFLSFSDPTLPIRPQTPKKEKP